MDNKEKETKIIHLFNVFFEESNEPICTKDFVKKSIKKMKGVYEEKELNEMLNTLWKKGYLQKTFSKKNIYLENHFAPIKIDIPIEKRNWLTEDEKNEALYKTIAKLNIKDPGVAVFIRTQVEKIASDKYKIEENARGRTNEFRQFKNLIPPYLVLFDKEEKEFLSMLLGLGNQSAIGMEKISLILNEKYVNIKDLKNRLFNKLKEITDKQIEIGVIEK